MAGHGFGGADKQPVFSVVAENGLDGLDFADVAQRSGGAVRVDVVDFFRLHSRVFQSHLHAAGSAAAFRVRGGKVVGVRGDAVADEFPVNFCAALLGVFQRFQNDNAGAFAHDEAVAVHVVRAGGPLGLVIAGAEGFHVAEPGHARGQDGSFRPAADHDVGIPEFHDAPGFPDVVVGGGAGRADGHVRTAEAVFHGDETGGNVADHVRNHEGGHAGRPFGKKRGMLAFQRAEAADAAAHHDADAGFVLRFQIQPGILESHSGSAHGKVREAVHAAGVLGRLEVRGGIEIFDFTGDFRGVAGNIHGFDGVNAAAASLHGFPGGCEIIAQGADHSDAGDNNSAVGHNKCEWLQIMLEPE